MYLFLLSPKVQSQLRLRIAFKLTGDSLVFVAMRPLKTQQPKCLSNGFDFIFFYNVALNYQVYSTYFNNKTFRKSKWMKHTAALFFTCHLSYFAP